MWLEDDRSWAIALHRLEMDECPGCGLPRTQTFDPALAEAWTVDELPNCAGCYAKAAKIEGAQPPGPLYRVRLRD